MHFATRFKDSLSARAAPSDGSDTVASNHSRIVGKLEVIDHAVNPGRSRSTTRSRNGFVAADSSAQPLNRTERGIVDSPSRLLAAVPRFLMVANTTGSARTQIPVGRPIRRCGRMRYDVRMAPPGEEQITCRLQRRIG